MCGQNTLCYQYLFLKYVLQTSPLDYPFTVQLVCFYYVLTTFTTVGYGELYFPASKLKCIITDCLGSGSWIYYVCPRRYCCFHFWRAGWSFKNASSTKYIPHWVFLKFPLIKVTLQIFCIFLFISAASLFGTIIAQVNEIVAQLTTKKKGLENILDTYLHLNPRFLRFS